ncbi:PREDICTED: mitotic spindle assembly checkpoint protein MAD2A [Bactrocera latifrons]|uniref:Mitotic spindle assembly checkpoint protein MAD2A n=2 Tax=Bactrocera TaxID=47832 RepID=A0A034W2Y3_BACDO|nr:mitotic spindle assembly checkpoint protein MAD2A [Bactrocera dorsalis]XP_018788054.1 PREDICTED: mitotic spindle assembly checkpoint protein MAD2A [Bactrocera latifrons]XP_039966329.1 mitotic spindle assembly checkpoint protein MAD2A [Bactrocera tryoni]XP_050332785.1 mitotic spindle assembly checkpoint protein MAD2A [Bactrocera neohumeralis]
MSTTQSTKNCITLRGSAQIIVEYLKYGINSILFQRGIYPPETFENTQQYGITILMSKDKKIEEFLSNVLQQTEDWLAKNMIEKISMVITNAHTKEVLECWDFKMQAELGDGETGDATKLTSSKELKRIQNEIRDVMRQISATVSYLPLLDCICTFDVMLYTLQNCEIPEKWDETGAVFIQNAQAVQLRSFSTGLHKVDTVVNYKMAS